MTIDDGVFACEVWLVEVVRVPDVGTAKTSIHDNWGVGADEHGYAASTTSGTGVALLVESDVASNNNSVTAIPCRGFDPVDRVEERVCSTVAGVHGVDTLDVVVARLLEELHEDRLDRLGLVEQSFGANFETADVLGVDIVLLEERSNGGQGERVYVCGASQF